VRASRPVVDVSSALIRVVLAIGILACVQPEEFPATRLMERAEARVGRARDELKASLNHYQLVESVSQEDLLHFMAQVRVFAGAERPEDLVLGTAYGVEPHGGGLLALLLEAWRPEGRTARRSDRFPFEGNAVHPSLGALYDALAHEVFLPTPSQLAETTPGALPSDPVLPRIRLHAAGLAPVEVDAYAFLLLLAAHESDLSRPWQNRMGQRLSAALLLEHARRYYLANGDTPDEPADHSRLHLVEVLLRASRRLGKDPDELVRHFLRVELQRLEFEPRDATLLLGHHAESLGLLLADERTRFDPDDVRRIRAWLARLETSAFRDVGSVDVRHLAHLLRGLRLVSAHRNRLDGP